MIKLVAGLQFTRCDKQVWELVKETTPYHWKCKRLDKEESWDFTLPEIEKCLNHKKAHLSYKG